MVPSSTLAWKEYWANFVLSSELVEVFEVTLSTFPMLEELKPVKFEGITSLTL